MRTTFGEQLGGILAGVIATLILLAGLIWRLSAWHSHLEERLTRIERRVKHLERNAGVPARTSHRARHSAPR